MNAASSSLPVSPPCRREYDLDEANTFLERGLVFEARELFARHVESDLAPRAWMGLARCAYQSCDLHEALANAQIVGQLDPDFPGLHNTLGIVLFGLGLADDARQQLLEAVNRDPTDPVVWRNLAHVEHGSGDHEACVAACERANLLHLPLKTDDAPSHVI